VTNWYERDPLTVGVYLTAARGSRGGAKLVDTFALDGRVKARHRWDDVKDAVKREVEQRGYKLRTVSAVHDATDIHVAAYVNDRGQGLKAIMSRAKPVRRDGPQGGPLGRNVGKRTAKTINRNRKG